MALVEVRIVEGDCQECLAELLEDCRRHWRGNPARERFYVPEEWLTKTCAHGGNGFKFERAPLSMIDDEEYSADAWNVEAPDGWLNLDSTKNIGYPAREEGRYGSHPVHDRYDGDSDP